MAFLLSSKPLTSNIQSKNRWYIRRSMFKTHSLNELQYSLLASFDPEGRKNLQGLRCHIRTAPKRSLHLFGCSDSPFLPLYAHYTLPHFVWHVISHVKLTFSISSVKMGTELNIGFFLYAVMSNTFSNA